MYLTGGNYSDNTCFIGKIKLNKCTELTSQNGCANDQCLANCKNCVLCIAFDDYAVDKIQHVNKGCDNSYFKIDNDFQ